MKQLKSLEAITGKTIEHIFPFDEYLLMVFKGKEFCVFASFDEEDSYLDGWSSGGSPDIYTLDFDLLIIENQQLKAIGLTDAEIEELENTKRINQEQRPHISPMFASDIASGKKRAEQKE